MHNLWLLIASFLLGPTGMVLPDDGNKTTAETFQVPFRLTETQHVLIRAKINGRGPYNFIVDTGAPALFVATAVAKQLDVSPDKNGWGTFQKFEIEGGVVVPNAKGRVETPFQLEGMNGLGLAGAELHGILGYTLLAKYRLEFDFTKDKMTWTKLDFEPPPPAGLMGKGGAPGGLDALGGIMKFMGRLLGKKADPDLRMRGFLGVELADVGGAIEIKAVLSNSPADRAGLKPGDRISHFQGKAVSNRAGLERQAAVLAPGQTARVTRVRAGNAEQVSIKLGEGL
jgi:hypothetical protein